MIVVTSTFLLLTAVTPAWADVTADPDVPGAAPQSWSDLDLKAPEPPNENLWDHWQRRTSEIMTNRRSSGVYQQSAARLSVWWELSSFDRERPWIDPIDETRARDLARFGALAGMAAVFNDTLMVSEPLQAVRAIATTFGGAHIRLEGRSPSEGPSAGDDGSPRVRVHYNDRLGELGIAETQLLTQDSRTRGPPRPTFSTGAAWQLTDEDADVEAVELSLSLATYLDLRNIAVDAVRVQLSLPVPALQPARQQDQAMAWEGSRLSLTARQGLLPSTDLVGNLRFEATDVLLPDSTGLGLTIRLPTERPWTLRPELRYSFPRPAAGPLAATPADWMTMVSLRADLDWFLPHQWGRWPLGEVPDEHRATPPREP